MFGNDSRCRQSGHDVFRIRSRDDPEILNGSHSHAGLVWSFTEDLRGLVWAPGQWRSTDPSTSWFPSSCSSSNTAAQDQVSLREDGWSYVELQCSGNLMVVHVSLGLMLLPVWTSLSSEERKPWWTTLTPLLRYLQFERDAFNTLICLAPESQNSFVRIAMCSVILWTCWSCHMSVIYKQNVYCWLVN